MNPPQTNPYRPGAGQMPPYLAGRETETGQFQDILKQVFILKNFILTGLRGVGKTVLLDTFRPIAIGTKWLWVGSDMSESASVNEDAFATRIITDLSVVTSQFVLKTEVVRGIGFAAPAQTRNHNLTYSTLIGIYNATPGLAADKLKSVLEISWAVLKQAGHRGIIFAYDEAQSISDHADKGQYPLSLMLSVFQSIQKKEIPFMLLLVGLPTLFPKLVEAKTFSERMFTVVALGRLADRDTREAILKPIEATKSSARFTNNSVELIVKESGGYPYFIQFICREVFDIFIQQLGSSQRPHVPIEEITRKLDKDFFAGRWAKATDRQRDLLFIISEIRNADDEFTVQEIVGRAAKTTRPFSGSHVNQMLSKLCEAGLVYKNRYGKYSFAVPLLGRFIQRQKKDIAAKGDDRAG